VADVWSQILRRVPGSRLKLLSYRAAEAEASLVGLFARHGIERDRIEVLPPVPHVEYLRRYHDIDVALDPFPFSGHTTSCDALWMGVPVVTLAGNKYAGRMTTSVLLNLGLPEFVCETPAQYVETAVSLAADLPRLRGIRAGLRQKMAGSVIVDAKRFTATLEDAYRTIWADWCERQR
jgi:protein O-GlcNAc transferase